MTATPMPAPVIAQVLWTARAPTVTATRFIVAIERPIPDDPFNRRIVGQLPKHLVRQFDRQSVHQREPASDFSAELRDVAGRVPSGLQQNDGARRATLLVAIAIVQLAIQLGVIAWALTRAAITGGGPPRTETSASASPTLNIKRHRTTAYNLSKEDRYTLA